MKRKIVSLSLLVLLFPLALLAYDLQIHFIDVGHGDCILIKTPDDGIKGNGKYEGETILIDGGEKTEGMRVIIPYLEKNGIPKEKPIDFLIMTHPDSDHVGGLIPVIENYQIKNIFDPGFEGKHTNLYKNFCNLSKNEPNCKFYKPLIGTLIKKEGEELNWGKELKVKVLRAEKNVTDVNNSSIVIWLEYGKVSFLLAGDIEGKERKADPNVSKWAERDLVKKYDGNLKSTFLKIPHHGSESSSTNTFITAVSPKYGIICAGNKKFQGTLLPDDSVIKRYEKAGVIIYRTDRDDQNKNYSKTSGDDHIIVITDGTSKGTKIRYCDEN